MYNFCLARIIEWLARWLLLIAVSKNCDFKTQTKQKWSINIVNLNKAIKMSNDTNNYNSQNFSKGLRL